MILTKSVSRFARNTVDALTTIRQLKEKNVAVVFEKEGVNTLDGTGQNKRMNRYSLIAIQLFGEFVNGI